MSLLLRGHEPKSVFDLMGRGENSATYAIGWVLEHCPALLAQLVQQLAGESIDTTNAKITLQKGASDGGYTDIEVRCDDQFEAIIEAKLGWEIPTGAQFERYRTRLSEGVKHRLLVSMSAATQEIARIRLPKELCGVRTAHVSYGELIKLTRIAVSQSRNHTSRLWASELIKHLHHYAAMSRYTSNLTYVVSLSDERMRPESPKTWIDVVVKDKQYFHPVGNRWPKEPPNYIAFRYAAQLRSIHRIESYEVILNVADINPTWADTSEDHFVYKLGPAMVPPRTVYAGGKMDPKIFLGAPVWCQLDTLLSGEFECLSKARDETHRRAANAAAESS